MTRNTDTVEKIEEKKDLWAYVQLYFYRNNITTLTSVSPLPRNVKYFGIYLAQDRPFLVQLRSVH